MNASSYGTWNFHVAAIDAEWITLRSSYGAMIRLPRVLNEDGSPAATEPTLGERLEVTVAPEAT